MSSNEEQQWRFFSNHFEVLLYVARHPDARLRTVAEEVGITERATHRILAQLATEGYVQVTKTGRRNHYRVTPGTSLRHPANRDVPLQPLLDTINPLARDIHVDRDGTSASGPPEADSLRSTDGGRSTG